MLSIGTTASLYPCSNAFHRDLGKLVSIGCLYLMLCVSGDHGELLRCSTREGTVMRADTECALAGLMRADAECALAGLMRAGAECTLAGL